MRITERFQSFATLPLRDKLYLLKMASIVATIEIGLRLLGMKKIVAFLGKQSKTVVNTDNVEKTVEQYQKLIFFLHLFFPFAGRCLARSLAAWWLLRRQGIETKLKIGIRKKNGKVLAHAWLEHNEKPLDYMDTVQTYIAFDNLALSKINLN